VVAADTAAKTYSGGMRRRLDLASSLLTRPRVLFLDEPTTGLDPRSRNEIWEIVRDLRREGTTILLTTQYLEEADQLADEIAVIDHGRVIAEGTGSQLKDRVGGQILEVELTDVEQRGAAEAVPSGVSCVDDLRPGIFLQSVTFRATNTAVGLSEDPRRGVIDRFRSMPMARSAVLVGRTTADLLRNVLIIGLMIGVGYLVGFRFEAGVIPAIACVALVAAFGFALSWIFAFVSLVVRGA